MIDFAGLTQRNEGCQFSMDSVFGGKKSAVSKPVMTFICVERCLYRLPSGSPDGSVMIDKIISAVRISGDVVITVAHQPEKFRVFIEAVAAAGVGN